MNTSQQTTKKYYPGLSEPPKSYPPTEPIYHNNYMSNAAQSRYTTTEA